MGQTKVLKVLQCQMISYVKMNKRMTFDNAAWCSIKGLKKSLLQAVIVYLIFHAQYSQCAQSLHVHFDEFNIIIKYYCCIDYILTSFVIITMLLVTFLLLHYDNCYSGYQIGSIQSILNIDYNCYTITFHFNSIAFHFNTITGTFHFNCITF